MSPSHLAPPNEEARLLALQKYGVSAAFAEPLFQELTDLAASIFGLPVAFLSLVDRTQVDFPATHGVPDLPQLPREAALCSLAVQQHTTVVLNTISEGSDSPHRQTAQRFQMEFYAGTPVLLEQQYAVGALCLSDLQPRTFSAPEEQVLTQLAALVSQALTLRWQAGAEAPRWQATQQLALEEVGLLRNLIRHLQAQPADGLLHVVARRLGQLQQLLIGESTPLLLLVGSPGPTSQRVSRPYSPGSSC